MPRRHLPEPQQAPAAASGIPLQVRRHLESSRVGRRYQRLITANEHQLAALIAVHPEVRTHVDEAVAALSSSAEHGTVDADAVAAASRVLDDLTRYGDIAMQRLVGQLREELTFAQGRPIEEVFTDH